MRNSRRWLVGDRSICAAIRAFAPGFACLTWCCGARSWWMHSTPHWHRSASHCPTRKPARTTPWPEARRSPTMRRCVPRSHCSRRATGAVAFEQFSSLAALARTSSRACGGGRGGAARCGAAQPGAERGRPRAVARAREWCRACAIDRAGRRLAATAKRRASARSAARQSTDQPLGVAVDRGLRSRPLGAAPSLVERRVPIGGAIS